VGEDPAVRETGKGNDENIEFTRESLEVFGLGRNFTIAAVEQGERPLPEHALGAGVGMVEGGVGIGGRGGFEGNRDRQGRCGDRVLGVRRISLGESSNIGGVKGFKGKSS
jgi:hypothetical protein